jgi:hypothetical protein
LLICHNEEREVLDIAALQQQPGDSDECVKEKTKRRKMLFEMIRNKGNFQYNKRVQASGEGSLILVRRPLDGCFGDTFYGSCPDCLGYYIKSDLWKHQKYFCVAKNSVLKSSVKI